MSPGVTAVTVACGVHFLATAQTLRTRDPWFTAGRRKLTALAAVIGLTGSLLLGCWTGAGFCAGTLALLLGDWWKRGGKQAARQLGSKSLAALALVVAKWREAGARPVPQGARA